MNKRAVQNERGPRKFKLHRNGNVSGKFPKTKMIAIKTSTVSINCPLGQENKNVISTHQDVLVQILLTCLKQSRQNEYFQTLSDYQQNVILQNVWSELFVLKASHWPINIMSSIEKCEDRFLYNIVCTTRTLNADLMELSLLEILILSRPEYAINSEERVKLEKLMENTVTSLGLYIYQQQHEQMNSNHDLEQLQAKINSRFANLLLGLRCLSLHFFESTLNNLFQNIAKNYFLIKV